MSAAFEKITRALGSIRGKRKAEDQDDRHGDGERSGPPSSKKPTHRRIVFRPWDQKDMLNRLETYRPLTWFSKPNIAGPIACASRGYYNEARDQLCCEFCGVRLLYPQQVPFEARPRAAALFAEQLAFKHEAHCPWRSTCSDENVLAFVLDGCPAASPPGLCAAYKARLDALECIDVLPELYPRAVQRLAAGAASSAAVRPATKLGRQSPGVPGLCKVLGLPLSGIAGATATAGNAMSTPARPGTGQAPMESGGGGPAEVATPTAPASSLSPTGSAAGGGLPQLVPPQGLTFMQRARVLALLGWECEELLNLEGAGPSPHAQPLVYWPSSSSYALAHLVGAPSIERRPPSQAQPGNKPPKRHMRMQSVALKCPICRSRVGLWNFVPKTQTHHPALSTPAASAAASACSTRVEHPLTPLVSLFKTIAGGSYDACAPGTRRMPGPPAPRFGSMSSSKPVFGLSAFDVDTQEIAQGQTPAASCQGGGQKRKAGEESSSGAGASTCQAGDVGQQGGAKRSRVQLPLGRAGVDEPEKLTSEEAGRSSGEASTSGPGVGGRKLRAESPFSRVTGRAWKETTSFAGGSVTGRSAMTDGVTTTSGRGMSGQRPNGGGTASGARNSGAATGSFDPLSYHRSWCPWIFTGHSDGNAEGPQSPHRAPRIKCGWMHLLDVLCAPPGLPNQALTPISMPSNPGTSLSDLRSPLATPASARAAAFLSGAGLSGTGQDITEGLTPGFTSQQQGALPESTSEVERLLEDTSRDRKDMRALKESILHNLRRS